MSEEKLRRYAPFLVILILTMSLLYAIIMVVDLNDRHYLRKSSPWISDQFTLEPNHEISFTITAPYAGYLNVNLDHPPGANVVFNVRYTFVSDFNFETNGISSFPVLPVKIHMALTNLNSNSSVTASLNVTYVY